MARIFNQTIRTTSTPFDLRPVRVYTASRTLREGDGTIIGDTSGGDITFTLPQAALCEGRMYVVVKKVAAGTITVAAASGDTIGYVGFPSVRLTDLDEDVSFLSGGSENVWYACKCSAPQPGEFDAAWHTTLTTAAGAFTVTNATQYLMVGTCSSPTIGQALISDAQWRAPAAFRIKRIYVTLNAVLAGTEVLTCRPNINGTANSGITVTHNSGTGTVEDASGSVSVAQDDLFCLEFGFSGGLTTKNLNNVTIAYAMAPA